MELRPQRLDGGGQLALGGVVGAARGVELRHHRLHRAALLLGLHLADGSGELGLAGGKLRVLRLQRAQLLLLEVDLAPEHEYLQHVVSSFLCLIFSVIFAFQLSSSRARSAS